MLTQTCSQGKMKAEIRVMPVTSRRTPEIIKKTPEARGEALRSLLRAPAERGLPQSPGKGPIPTSIFIWDLQPPHWDATSPLFKLSSLWHFVTVALENEHPLEVPNSPGSERLLQGKGTHRNHSVWSFHDPWRNSIWNGPPIVRVRDWLRNLGSWLLGGVPFFHLAVLLVRRYIHIPIYPYIAQSCSLFVTPWTVAHQASPSMGFSRQEYWSGLPFPPPGDLPDPGIKLRSPALQADALTSEPPGKPEEIHGERLISFNINVPST